MKNKLSHWTIESWSDDEINKYHFLDYLSRSFKELKAHRLFPVWEDLYENYRSAKDLRQGVKQLLDLSPYDLSGFNTAGNPERMFTSPNQREVLLRMEERLNFALPRLKYACQKSEEFRREHLSQITLEPLGLWVFNNKEGLLMAKYHHSDDIWTWVYREGLQKSRYRYTAFETQFMGKYRLSLTNTLLDIKNDSLNKAGLNKSVVSSWIVEATGRLPVFSSLKPLAIFKLMETLES